MSKKRAEIERVADELADTALRQLRTFSESEQEARLSAAERVLRDNLTNAKECLK
jgi:hypothetical protein